KLLARKILADRNIGGGIFASKPEDKDDFWGPLFKEAGRLHDLTIFAEDQPNKCNFINVLRNWGADPLPITQFATISGEFLDQDAQKGERYWQQGTRWQILNSIVPIMLSDEPLTIPNIAKFISTAPLNDAQLESDQYKGGFFKRVMDKAVT